MDTPVELSNKEFKALSAQNRVEILKLLKDRNYNLTELSNRLNISIPSVQKHLNTLVLAGLIERVIDDRKWAYYTLTKKGKAIATPGHQRFSLLLATAFILGILIVAIALFNSTVPVPLESPQITLITYNAQAKSIELSWTSSAQHGVLYEIQRKTKDDAAFETIQTGISTNRYSDRDITENESYVYRIIAHQNGQIAGSESQTVTTQKTVPPPNGTPSTPDNISPIPPASSPSGSAAPDSNGSGSSTNDSNSVIEIELQAFMLSSQAGQFDQTIWFEGQPTTLTVQKDSGPAVLLAWNAPSFTNPLFEIQKLNQNGQWDFWISEIAEPFWVDTQMDAGQTTTYRIQVFSNGQVYNSNSISVFIP